KKAAISKDLSALVTKMDDKASVWMVGVLKGKLDNLKLPKGGGAPENLQGQLAKMETVAVVVRVTADISLDVTIGMKDGDSADELGKTIEDGLMQLKGILPFLTAQNPQLKPLGEAAKTLKSSVKDKNVNVSAKLAHTGRGPDRCGQPDAGGSGQANHVAVGLQDAAGAEEADADDHSLCNAAYCLGALARQLRNGDEACSAQGNEHVGAQSGGL